MKYLLIFLSIPFMISCTRANFTFDKDGNPIPAGSADSSASEAAEENGSTASLRGLIAVDDNNVEIGYILSAGVTALTLLSDQGYVYSIYWDGSTIPENTYYTTTDCTGTGYKYAGTNKYSGEMVHPSYDGTISIALNTETSGLATTSTVTAGSLHYATTGACQTTGASGNFIELLTTSRTFVGIPSSIASPLTLEEI